MVLVATKKGPRETQDAKGLVASVVKDLLNEYTREHMDECGVTMRLCVLSV